MWDMTIGEARVLAELPPVVDLWYVGDGVAGGYYLDERTARGAILAYAIGDVRTSMHPISLERGLVMAIDLERRCAQIGASAFIVAEVIQKFEKLGRGALVG